MWPTYAFCRQCAETIARDVQRALSEWKRISREELP
jgi:hypothetical protein